MPPQISTLNRLICPIHPYLPRLNPTCTETPDNPASYLGRPPIWMRAGQESKQVLSRSRESSPSRGPGFPEYPLWNGKFSGIRLLRNGGVWPPESVICSGKG